MKKTICYTLFLFAVSACKGQCTNTQKTDTSIFKKNTMDTIPIVTNSFEKLDIQALEENGERIGSDTPPPIVWIIDTNEYYRSIGGSRSSDYTDMFFPNTSYFCIEKKIYKNGNVKEKGLKYGTNGFKKGIWYEFNELGNLTKQTDYDKFTKFSWEDVLAYLKQQKIEVSKGYQRQGGFHTRVTKTYFYKTDSCTWTIEWLKKWDIIQRITLDGNTGKVLDKIDLHYENN